MVRVAIASAQATMVALKAVLAVGAALMCLVSRADHPIAVMQNRLTTGVQVALEAHQPATDLGAVRASAPGSVHLTTTSNMARQRTVASEVGVSMGRRRVAAAIRAGSVAPVAAMALSLALVAAMEYMEAFETGVANHQVL